MASQVLYSGDLSLAELERRLNSSEAIHGGLRAIDFRDGDTLATFGEAEEQPARLLLVIDPGGMGLSAPGTRLAFRGDAGVKGERVVISVFRPSKPDKSGGSAPSR